MMMRCLGCMTEYERGYAVCPYCGYEAGTQAESPLHMHPGSSLSGRYIVGKVIGYGGFGVTYIGWDSVLKQRVAIKEYLPSEFATRAVGQTNITVFGGNKAEQFADGMIKFVDEAKRLAKFQYEEGVVRIFDSFEANNTAYIIMEYLDGETLASYLEREGKIPVDQAVEMLMPVIQSLEAVHRAGIIHRDIAPDNIMLTKEGKVKLIDFGAARYATTSHSRSLTVIIKPGYSPEEQYRSRGDQGPHTDVYALGAVLYRMITGVTPPDALERRAFFENKKKDILVAPSKNSIIKKNKENAILNAMNVRIEDRTPTAKAFLAQLTSTSRVQRVMGKIKAIDLIKWPLWAKIVVPVGTATVATLFALLLTGVISSPPPPSESPIPDDMTRVPSVINYSVGTAQDRLDEQELIPVIGGREVSDTIPANMVLRQSINAGEIVDKRSSVELFISAVPNPVVEDGTMPDIAYYTEAEAVDILRQLGAVVAVEREYSGDIADGLVIRSSIGMGEPLAEGTEVTLYVSKGPDPDSVTDTPDESEAANEPDVSRNPAVALNRSALSLFVGDKVSLTASGGNGSYSWSSSNPSVAAVNNGTVSAVGKGSATITVSSDGKTATCPVTVQDYSLSLSDTYISMFAGESKTISASGAPSGATVSWSSSNSRVATVNNGQISAVAAGNVTITAQFTSGGRGYSATCQVNISETGITLSQYSISDLYVGGTASLSATTSPSGQSVSWSSSNPSVVTVSNGQITAVGAGSATITAQFVYGGVTYSESCSVSVVEVSVRLSDSSLSMSIGDSEYLSAITSPRGTSVSWSSSNLSVASVDSSGKVTAVGAGSSTITAQINYEGRSATATCSVNVTAPSIQLSSSKLSMTVGDTESLSAYTTPSGQSVIWSSSNTSVATVNSNGIVSAVGGGSATISAQITCNGKTYTDACSLTVNGGHAPEISLGWIHVWLSVGDQDTIGLMNSTTKDADITWSSSDSNIVRVDSTGTVTAISPGTVTITATITNQWGSNSDTCKITVEGATQGGTNTIIASATASNGNIALNGTVTTQYGVYSVTCTAYKTGGSSVDDRVGYNVFTVRAFDTTTYNLQGLSLGSDSLVAGESYTMRISITPYNVYQGTGPAFSTEVTFTAS